MEYEVYNRRKIPFITEKEIMEEEKYVGADTEKEATLSYYSENSVNKAVRDSKIEESN